MVCVHPAFRENTNEKVQPKENTFIKSCRSYINEIKKTNAKLKLKRLLRTICRKDDNHGKPGLRLNLLRHPPKLATRLSSAMVVQERFSHNQAELPRLPVPALKQTLDKYLRTVQPLVTPEEYAITKEIVEKFGGPGGAGQELQKLLEKRASRTENWLSDWWIKSAYLDYRYPVVVWSSPGLVFPLQKFECLDDQINFAAKVAAGALNYKVMVDNKTVPQDMMGKHPLDMSQYFRFLSTCRIPGVTRDSLRYFGLEANSPTHIVVSHNNHYFRIEVYDENGHVLSWKQIAAQFRNIVERSTHPTKPVGILSSQNRNVWGKAYKTLMKNPVNRSSIEDIQRSIFMVCLDGPQRQSTGNDMTDAALMCVHGGGSQENSGNRWFDKTIQFVVGKTGAVGLTYEHSPAEGPPIANLMDHIMDCVTTPKLDKVDDAADLMRPLRLKMEISPEIDDEISIASSALDSMVEDLEMTCFKFKHFGKNFIKSYKLSPDSFIQMAIQLAFYRIHGEPAAHYESASTRKFIYGRTETVRSCSIESVQFAKTMLSTAPISEKVTAMKAGIESHKNYVLNAVSGEGVDRHLLGLKLSAIEAGLDVPSLFMDVGYVRSSHMRLSTSQVPARYDAFMCFGPLVPDGYGCCYNPRPETIEFGTSAYNSSPETHSSSFRAALEQSLLDMRDTLKQSDLKSKL